MVILIEKKTLFKYINFSSVRFLFLYVLSTEKKKFRVLNETVFGPIAYYVVG